MLYRWNWKRALLLAVAGPAGCASSCNPGSSGATANGELGNGTFAYDCVGATDPECGLTDTDPLFPECIALGGRFRLTYTLRDYSARNGDNLGVNIRVEAGDQSFFAGGDTLQAVRPGRSVMLAREDEQVLDMIHLSIVEPTQIRFEDALGTTIDTVHVPGHEIALVDVFPESTSCPILGGAMDLQVSGGNPAIATASVEDGRIVVTGVDIGSTRLQVTLGDLKRSLNVEVSQGPPIRTSGPLDPATGTGAGGTDTDASTGIGTGTGTGTGTGGTGG